MGRKNLLLTSLAILGIYPTHVYSTDNISKEEISVQKTEFGGSESANKIIGLHGPDQSLNSSNYKNSSCNWWWIYGRHRWKWSGIPGLYIYHESWGMSKTEYGTSQGGCGIPLTVDRLYVKVVERPRTWQFSIYDKVGYNTSYVEAKNSGHCVGSCRAMCGAYSYHEALKSGVKWHVSVYSGCRQ